MTDIKQECKEKVYAAIEESYICTATTEILDEFLDEVYRKAEAWDEVAEMIPDLKDWEINDLDFSQTVENVYDRLERDSQ